MGESAKHMELVQMVRREVEAIVGVANAMLILVDTPDSNEKVKVGKFCPDVFFRYDKILAIGEAKTLDDFSRSHSNEQFEAYLTECNLFEGAAVLVASVPWQLAATAKNYFRRLRRKFGTKTRIVVLDDTKWRWEV